MNAAEVGVDGRVAGRTLAAWVPAAAVLLGTGWGAQQFTPLLLVYRQTLGLSTGTVEALFGIYAVGLIPGLLVAGPLSDVWGRRAVILPAAGIGLLATLVLVAGANTVGLLFLGRLLAGISSGAVFGTGTAWLRELSGPPWGAASDHDIARRAAVAMTLGFATGPLVAGVLAQWVPHPTVIPYLPHIALMLVALVLVRYAPETLSPGERRSGDALDTFRVALPAVRSPRFRRVVAPMAPWVFAAPAIAFGLLPSVVGAEHVTNGIALTAGITALTAFTGVLIQPVARRLDAGASRNRAATVGLLVVVAALALGAVTAHVGHVWLLVPSGILFGAAYGLCLVAGLVEVQRMADKRSLAGLTAIYYALTYLGFAAPYLLTLGAHLTTYAVLLVIAAGLALGTAGLVGRRDDTSPAE
jgi:hypothetical protein